MSCAAPPGWFCSPLDNSHVICPVNWYCQGGHSGATACPDGTWSTVGSPYIDSCKENSNLALVSTVVFIVVLVGIFLCTLNSCYISYPENRCNRGDVREPLVYEREAVWRTARFTEP